MALVRMVSALPAYFFLASDALFGERDRGHHMSLGSRWQIKPVSKWMPPSRSSTKWPFQSQPKKMGPHSCQQAKGFQKFEYCLPFAKEFNRYKKHALND